MLELYHSINSVCAQKVRIALAEKGLEYKEHLMTLRGDQYDPAYMKLNPNAVVPTLIHDGQPIVESSVILHYIDDTFPSPPLMPTAPLGRARVHLFNKLVDEYVHNSCMILTFATAFRPPLARLNPAELEAQIGKTPIKKRAELKRDVIVHGLDSQYVRDALDYHEKLLSLMEDALTHGPYLGGETFSLAEAAVIPYILRLDLLRLAPLWAKRPAIAAWYERVRERPSFSQAITGRMTEADAAPFKNISPDPWPKISGMLKAA
jgi:glutathione S-transferase